MTSRVFASIGNFSVRFRWLIVIGWVFITIVSVKAFPGLSDVAKDSQSSFLPASSPSVQAENLAQPFQDSQHGIATLVAARESGVLTASDLQEISTIETRIKALSGVHSRAGLRALSRQARGAGAGGHRPAALQRGKRRHITGRDDPRDVSERCVGAPGSPHGNIPGFVDQQSQSKSSQG